MILHCRKRTIRYKDYGSPMGSQEGLQWCTDEGQGVSFEPGDYPGKLAEKRGKLPPGWLILEFPAVTVSCDLNPRGLI